MQYENSKAGTVWCRCVKTKKDCKGECKYSCALNISKEQRGIIFQHFGKLSDDEKRLFFSKTVTRYIKKRSRVKGTSRRKFSYTYRLFVDKQSVRVCKEFYISTLDISQRRISYFFENMRQDTTGIPRTSTRGQHKGNRKYFDEHCKFVVDHINSYPKVESHYCRSSSNRQYLEAGLSVNKMYEMHQDKCDEAGRVAV